MHLALPSGMNPVNGVENLFPGLSNTGSFLDELYTTWTQQFIDALGTLGETPAVAGEAVGSSVPGLLTGLLSF